MDEIVGQPETTPSGYLRPCSWPAVNPVMIWLVGIGFAGTPRKIIPSSQTVREVETGVEERHERGHGRDPDPVFSGGSDHSDPFDAEALAGPGIPNDGFRTKPTGPVHPKWCGRIHSPCFCSGYDGGDAEVVPAFRTSNLGRVLRGFLKHLEPLREPPTVSSIVDDLRQWWNQ